MIYFLMLMLSLGSVRLGFDSTLHTIATYFPTSCQMILYAVPRVFGVRREWTKVLSPWGDV